MSLLSSQQPAGTQLVSTALFAELARRYTELKLCHDDEDGFFIQHEYGRGIDCWVLMDLDSGSKRETVEDAVLAAVEYHNHDVSHRRPWETPISVSANALDDR